MEAGSNGRPSVLLYVPNLICYARLVIISLTALLKEDRPGLCVAIYLIFAISDGFDGWMARKLGQCSSFGAWLDVIVDNFGRTIIWSNFQWGFIISNLEWIVFVCNHRHGAGWKDKIWSDSLNSAPYIVNKVMEKGFKTPLGILAIFGLHGLPIWMFAYNHQIMGYCLPLLPTSTPLIGFVILAFGRILCIIVEVWCILVHIKCLLSDESRKIE